VSSAAINALSKKYFCEILTKVDNYYRSKKKNFLKQYIEVNMNKIVIKILKGSLVTVTQTVLGELTINSPVANFLQCMSAKNYESWLAVDKVNAIIKRCHFMAHTADKTVVLTPS